MIDRCTWPHLRSTLIVLLALALAACTGARLRHGVDMARIDFRASNDPAGIHIDGPGSKSRGARGGAVLGAGGGLALGAMLCLAAGPLAALCAGPALAVTAVGATGGAVAGALGAETEAQVEHKRVLLATTLAACTCAERLAAELRGASPSGAGTPPEWSAELQIAELATLGSGPDRPFALRMVARLELSRSAGGTPLLVKDYAAVSAHKLRLPDWERDQAAALHTALAEAVRALAAQIRSDLQAAR